MSSVEHFIHGLEYLARDRPDLLDEFRQDICRDLQIFFAYIKELENPVDRPEIKDELEAQDDFSFNSTLAKYRGMIRDTDLGNLRREASAIRREGDLSKLLQQLCIKPQEEVA